ncbi:SRPBCC family protein [Streptomyces hypolithicus]
MTEYERSRTMPALAEQVFDQAANLDQMSQWMPEDLHVRSEEPPTVTVHEDRTDEDTAGLFRAHKDQMRLEWGSKGDGSYTGWLQVAGVESGASEVTVHLSFFDEDHDPGDAVNDALERSLERLEQQVLRLRGDSPAG